MPSSPKPAIRPDHKVNKASRGLMGRKGSKAFLGRKEQPAHRVSLGPQGQRDRKDHKDHKGNRDLLVPMVPVYRS